jgi:NAD(P)-dependent dehydrogenase (short-subunit alcohol dehydrogenase family)
VVVNNRNRVVDGDGLGPADHVAFEIAAFGGSAVASYSDASDPAAGEEMVEAALSRWGRLDICVARAAMAVMRPAGHGRIILVASTGGLHGDIGLSAYAASKGGLLAFGRSLAAEGAGKGVLTNMLLPYALTQMTADGISDDGVRRRMTAGLGARPA